MPGEVVEAGSPADLLSDPRHPYTWALLHAAPRLDEAGSADRRLTTIEGQPPDARAWPEGCRFRARCPFAIDACAEHPALLPVGEDRLSRCWVTQSGGALHAPAVSARFRRARAGDRRGAAAGGAPALTRHFPLPKAGFLEPRRVLHALDGVDLRVHPGETVGLVGESGSGKSTLARLVMRLDTPTGGTIRFAGQDITHASQAAIRPLRRRMQMIFQDPYALAEPAHDGGTNPGGAAAVAWAGDRCGGGAGAGCRVAGSGRAADDGGGAFSA